MLIGIVDACDDPNLEADLGVFSTQFHLPACTTGNGCFTKITNNNLCSGHGGNWALEQSLDVEWAHAMAPAAKLSSSSLRRPTRPSSPRWTKPYQAGLTWLA